MNTTRRPLLTLHNVTKRYRTGKTTVDAVRHISMQVYPSELLAITGPSGSGKTTLSHIIGGLAQPSEGTVQFGAATLASKSDRALSLYRNKSVGFIFQNYQLIPHYTALENVTIPLIVQGMRPRKRRAIASELLASLGLEKQQHQRSDQLSGGQKQRVAIARALAGDPEILIADEPTGNLDSKNSEEVMQTLEALAKHRGVTVIMVTHNPALAKRADRVVRMVDGMLAEEQ
jgi:putative ABC transport system ATP-binding protein